MECFPIKHLKLNLWINHLVLSQPLPQMKQIKSNQQKVIDTILNKLIPLI